MKITNKTLNYQTKELFEFIDITDGINNFVKEKEIKIRFK